MHIPIVSIDHFRKNPPDIAVLFSWNHKNEILKKEKEFTKRNGRWIWHTKQDFNSYKNKLKIKKINIK